MENLIDINKTVRTDFPKIFHFDNMDVPEFISWYHDNLKQIEDDLLQTGAILFRGINIDELTVFEQVMDPISKKFLSYIDGNSPRTKLSAKVYTSTEYDPNYFITLHNELSYSAKWPSKIFFCCLIPAPSGGETPIADCRRVLRHMEPALVQKIKTKKIKYQRNLHGGKGFGPSWQDTFETKDKNLVEQYCRQGFIQYEWKSDGGIKLIHVREGIIKHPVSGEEVWFNQIDQFHPSHFDQEIYETLMLMYGNDETQLPTYVTFGDDTPISTEVVKEIRKTVDGETMKTPWQKGDLLLLDNVLTSHGRMPYKGNRRIVVSMSE
jgi:hypothetical protein